MIDFTDVRDEIVLKECGFDDRCDHALRCSVCQRHIPVIKREASADGQISIFDCFELEPLEESLKGFHRVAKRNARRNCPHCGDKPTMYMKNEPWEACDPIWVLVCECNARPMTPVFMRSPNAERYWDQHIGVEDKK